MGEEVSAQRLRNAIKAAIRKLDQPELKFDVEILPGNPFHIMASYPQSKKIRMIRITLDKINPIDISMVEKKIYHSDNFNKEIWCKRKGARDFETREIT